MKTYEKGISLSIWTLSWPIFIEVFLQLLVGNIDQLMMSHYSPQAVAAVANANQILNIFIMLIVVMSTATTILIAQYLGARNQSKLSEVCTVSLVLNFVFSFVAAVRTFLRGRFSEAEQNAVLHLAFKLLEMADQVVPKIYDTTPEGGREALLDVLAMLNDTGDWTQRLSPEERKLYEKLSEFL